MNDKSQIKYHIGEDPDLPPVIDKTEEGYQSKCPICPWTSGIRNHRYVVNFLYYTHISYVFNNRKD